ncbi:MAG: hypothetical protein JNN28_20920 [Saprospiraceae bacterium]|nr:hypothetical protein [Saprospiraceae bacterium]
MKNLAIIFMLSINSIALMAQYDIVYDSTFGTDGTVILPYQIVANKGLFLQSDGKVVLLSNKKINNSTTEFTTIRLNPNGTLDLTYNNAGLNNSPTSFDSDPDMCGLMFPNNDLIVAGSEPYINPLSAQGIHFYKYLENGRMDSLFGNGGVLTIKEDSSFLFCKDMIRYNDTSLLMLYIGYPFPNSTVQRQLVICKVNLNGQLDSSFAVNGKLRQPLNPYPDALKITLDDHGAIYVAVNYNAPSLNYNKIIKLNPDLTLNTAFNFQIDPPNHSISNVAFDEDGKLIIIASRIGYGYKVWRFMPNGVPDNSFSKDGLFVGHLNYYTANPKQFIQQPDGKILIGINIGANAIRLNLNGTMDFSFDLDGVVELVPYLGTGVVTFRSSGMELLPDGKMLFMTETDTDQIKIIQVKTRP